ncbi:MAG: hypothetical protein ABI142_02675, partial [Bryocella sp.]
MTPNDTHEERNAPDEQTAQVDIEAGTEALADYDGPAELEQLRGERDALVAQLAQAQDRLAR